MIHCFWVPSLNGKRDAVPNRDHPWKLEADEPGEFVGQCTEFCGLSHAEMRIKAVAARPRSDFDELGRASSRATRRRPTRRTTPREEAQGYRLFVGQLCSSCHLIEGVNDDKFGEDDAVTDTRADQGPGASRCHGTPRTSPT